MSWPAVAWAMAQRAPSSPAKFLLVVLADAASAGDWLAWPSAAYLGETTQQDRKTVLSNLKRLEEARLIDAVGKTGKTKQVTVWRLPVVARNASGKCPKTGTVQTTETVPDFLGNSTGIPPKESQKRDTEPVLNQSVTKESASAARKPAADRGSRLVADWILPSSWRDWALEQRPDLNPDATAANFADYWRAIPGAAGRKVDWLATWRKWVRNERAPAGSGAGGRGRGVLHADNVFAGSI